MEPDWRRLANGVISSLSDQEKEEAIVYVEQHLVPAGEPVPQAGPGRSFDEPVVIAFVDLEPSLNWTHRARYLVLGVDARIRESVDVDRPPYLTGVSPRLRLIHRGGKAPEWAAVAPTLVL